MILKKTLSEPMSYETVRLPADHIVNYSLFTTVRIDLAGLLFLKNSEKVWIELFTCTEYRAVHLEPVSFFFNRIFSFSSKTV